MARRQKKTTRKFDRKKVEHAIKLLLQGVGEDPSREGLIETPRRVCDFYQEILSGMWTDPSDYLVPLTVEHTEDVVIVRDIRFCSICEHHLLPFIGKVSVAYLSDGGRIVGISKIVRVVDMIAKRLQIQERMTNEIADLIEKRLNPAGVFVLVEAEHLCMTIRGVKKPGTMIVTTEARGVFKDPERQRLVQSWLSR